MSRRFLAPLLFCVALLTQALAPAFLRAAPHGEMASEMASVMACKEQHGDHVADAGKTDAGKTDAGKAQEPSQRPSPAGHDHDSCPFCRIDANAAALDAQAAPAVDALLEWSRANFAFVSDPERAPRLNGGARARAPPSSLA
jgi:hypothetical protein